MVSIRYLNKKGDEVLQMELEEAQKVIDKEIKAGNIVFDEDERRIVTKATKGQLKQDSRVGIQPGAFGG